MRPTVLPRFSPTPAGRALIVACAALALIAGILALEGPRPTGAQDVAACTVTDLGALDASTGPLTAEGRWTTQDCDSAFLPDSDAHTYRFALLEGGPIRINLTSPDGDPYLHLLAHDRTPLLHDDDGGDGLNARIERDLDAGIYFIEAALGSGRSRGGADFALTIQIETSCVTEDLGVLNVSSTLTAEGSWTDADCSARFRESTSADSYRFVLAQPSLVRIALNAHEDSDPFVYLLSADGDFLYSDDDGGPGRNSLLEAELPAGTYLIEATTFRGRDHTHLLTDYQLAVSRVDPTGAKLKTELAILPEVVIVNEPFTVQFRVGNRGLSDLPEGHFAWIWLAGPDPSSVAWLGPITADNGDWKVGVSYHSGEDAASATSIPHPRLPVTELTITEVGRDWVVFGTLTYDADGNYLSIHRIERNLVVLSGPTYGPVTVTVDGAAYEVTATASTAEEDEGVVTTTVTSVADPEAEVEAEIAAQAIYAAGVRATVLDGLFERPALADRSTAATPSDVSIANASSSTLLRAFAEQYAAAIDASGLGGALTRSEVIKPSEVERVVTLQAAAAAAQYAALADRWRALQARIADGGTLTIAEAVALQTELAYAERILAPTLAAGAIVADASADVDATVAELAEAASCDNPALGDALASIGIEDVNGHVALDRELRTALPVLGLATDATLCGAAGVDAANARFLERLGIESEELTQLNAPDPAPEADPEAEAAAPAPHRLRIIARLGEDGRIEHGVQLADGTQVLPDLRFLPSEPVADRSYASGDIEVDGSVIGQVRAQLLADGRIELGFLDANGAELMPESLFLLADPPVGVWLRSGEVEVPAAASE